MAKFRPEYKHRLGIWVTWTSITYERIPYTPFTRGIQLTEVVTRHIGKIIAYSHHNRNSIWYEIATASGITKVDRTYLETNGIIGKKKTLETLYGKESN